MAGNPFVRFPRRVLHCNLDLAEKSPSLNPHPQTNPRKQNEIMKLTLTTNHAAHLLIQDENANWTRAGAFALVEYLEELEENTGVEIEFCPVAIRCDYSQADSLQNWLMEHHGASTLDFALEYSGIDMDGTEDTDEIDDLIRSYIQNHGTLLEFDGGIIVSSF
jgi:hypothetical protein